MLRIVEIVSNTSLLDRLAYNLIMKTGGSYAGIFMGLALIGIVFGVLIPSASDSNNNMNIPISVTQKNLANNVVNTSLLGISKIKIGE